MKILLRGALLIWTQIFSHLKSSKKFWSVKNSVFGCNWASTFSYHFKLDYLCCLDEKENGHQLFDFPPIPPSRPGSSPSNGFMMKLWNDDLCGLINFVLIFTWKYWSTVFSHPTSSWLCATRWTFSLDNLTLYDLVLQGRAILLFTITIIVWSVRLGSVPFTPFRARGIATILSRAKEHVCYHHHYHQQ